MYIWALACSRLGCPLPNCKIFSYARERPHFDTNANFLPRRGNEVAASAVFVEYPREENIRLFLGGSVLFRI